MSAPTHLVALVDQVLASTGAQLDRLIERARPDVAKTWSDTDDVLALAGVLQGMDHGEVVNLATAAIFRLARTEIES